MALTNEQPKVTWTPPRVEWILPILVGRWRFIVVVAGLSMTAIICAAIIRGPVYTAKTSLLVRLGRETSSTSSGTTSEAQATVATKRPEDVNNEAEILKSQWILNRLVDAFGVDYFLRKDPPRTLSQWVKRLLSDAKEGIGNQFDRVLASVGLRRQLSDREKVLAILQSIIRIDSITRSDVVEVSLMAKNPEVAQALLDKYVELFLEQHIQAHTSPKTRTFFEAQKQDIGTRLAEAIDRQWKLRESVGAWSPSDQRGRLLDWQQQIRSARTNLQSTVAGLAAEIASLKQQASELPAELNVSRVEKRNVVMDKLHEQEVEKSVQLETLKRRYADDSRTVLDVQHDLDEVRAAIRSEERMLVDSVTTEINDQRERILSAISAKQALMEGYDAQIKQHTTQIAQIDSELRNLGTTEIKLTRIDREIFRMENDFALYARSTEEARIFEQMDSAKIANVTVITPPTASPIPISPSLKFLGLTVVGVGLGLPIALTLLWDVLRPSIRSRKDVQEFLGVPVVARIPEISRL